MTIGTKLQQELRDIELLALNDILHFDLLSLFQFRVPGGLLHLAIHTKQNVPWKYLPFSNTQEQAFWLTKSSSRFLTG